MRPIHVSTSVYAAIWAQRKEGEESEDDILRRLLKTGPAQLSAPSPQSGHGGVIDGRSGVRFDEGFRIFRRYKGRDYNAVATGGHWRREDTGAFFASLNQLNASIVAGTENVWNGAWKFHAADGKSQSIAALRR